VISTQITSDDARTLPATDFGNYTTLFSLFRVVNLRVRLCPVVSPANNTLNNGILYICASAGAASPSGTVPSDCLSFPQCSTYIALQFTHLTRHEIDCFKANPMAKLWTSIGTAISTQSAVALQIRASGLLGSATYYDVDYEWDVEFSASA